MVKGCRCDELPVRLGYEPDDDPDGDGAPNWFEYESGTDPTDSHSAFVASSDPLQAEEEAYHVRVKTEPGRKYVIWITDGSLGSTTTWRTFNDISNGVGTWLETKSMPAKFTFVDDFSPITSGGKPETGVRYYRVKAEMP